jgi:hypothetical protein
VALRSGAGRGPAHLKRISQGPALATLTTLDPAFLAPNTVLSNGNLTVTRLSSAAASIARATRAVPPAGAFWEVTVDAYTTAINNQLGVADSSNSAVNGGVGVGGNLTSGGIDMTAAKIYNSSRGGMGAPGNVAVGATLLFLYLPAAQHLHIFNPANGWDVGGGGTISPDSGASAYASIGPTCYPAATPADVGAKYTFNFGAAPWVNTAAVATCIAAGFQPLS